MKNLFGKIVCIAVVCTAGTMPLAAQYEKWNMAFGVPFLNKNGVWYSREFERNIRSASGIGFHGDKALRINNRTKNPILGISPNEIRANYTPAGQLAVIDVFFSNKGDNADIKKIRKLIRDTARTLEKKLTGIGGTPVRCDYGHRKMQNNALKWSCGKTDIVLEYVNKEYVVLHICYPVQNVPAAMTAKKDVSVKNADVSENVASNLFGDVYIENIPMVEQGNKGYCVPATVERVLRYYGINNINMHQLADAGNTRQGGGTSSREMFKGISSACRRSGLKMNSPGEVRLKMIKKYIDKGIPLFWSMYSNAEYEKLRSRNRYLRERAASPQEWAEKNKKLTVPRDGDGHMCLIIGYNELSREIAVSNSWGGAEVHPSWVPLHIAVKVSQGSTVVLMPR